VQNEISEGQKGEKRHIVCYKHRADKGYVNQRENTKAGVFEFSDYGFCQRIEKAYVSERANHRKNAEKAGKRFEIEVVDIFFVGRHYYRSNDSGKRGNKHNGV
jgi:hypothetical protein